MSDFAEIQIRCPRCARRLTAVKAFGDMAPNAILVLECRPCDEANARGKPAPANDLPEPPKDPQ